jgi:hypothetical protein
VKAKILNLEEACKLYDLIGKFFPTEPTTAIKALHAMVVEMGEEIFFEFLGLMTGENKETLVSMDNNERLSVLLTGWEQNKLFELPRLKQDGLCGR